MDHLVLECRLMRGRRKERRKQDQVRKGNELILCWLIEINSTIDSM